MSESSAVADGVQFRSLAAGFFFRVTSHFISFFNVRGGEAQLNRLSLEQLAEHTALTKGE